MVQCMVKRKWYPLSIPIYRHTVCVGFFSAPASLNSGHLMTISSTAVWFFLLLSFISLVSQNPSQLWTSVNHMHTQITIMPFQDWLWLPIVFFLLLTTHFFVLFPPNFDCTLLAFSISFQRYITLNHDQIYTWNMCRTKASCDKL